MRVHSKVGRLLRRLVRVSCLQPRLTVLLAVLLAALSVAYAFHTLRLATSTRALLPRQQPYLERYAELERQFGELDALVIVVEAPSLPETTVYATRLTSALREARVPLLRVTYRIDPRQFEGRALLYLSKDRLAEIRDRIFDYQEFMESFAARPTLDRLVESVSIQIAGSFVTGFFDFGVQDPKKTLDVKFVKDLIGQMDSRLDRPAPYQSPWSGLFSVPDDTSAGYFLSEDQRLLFILAKPHTAQGSFTGDRAAIDGIRDVVARLRSEFPDVRVGVTGKAALANDEMTAAFRDSERANGLAFALTLGLLVLAFLRVGKPLLMLFVLALTLAWSIGLVTLVIGHLSLFSVVFISIVIGIGVDYGIYYLFRYEEELFLGRTLREALEISARRSGPGMLLGALTAAGTFFVLMVTDFRGIQELGFVAGSAILLAWVGMMTVFPACIALVDRRHASRPAGMLPRAIALERLRVPLVDRLLVRPRLVLGVAAVATLASLAALGRVHFDYNMLNLQAPGAEAVAWERRILSTSGRSGFAALSSADSLDELRRRQEAFTRLPSVSSVESALLLVPDDQAEKQKIIGDFAPLVAPITIGRPTRVDIDHLTLALESLKRRFALAAAEAPAGDLQRQLREVDADVGRLLGRLRAAPRNVSEPALTVLQQQLYRDFVRNFQRLQANLTPGTVGLADVPDEVRRRFVSDEGQFLMQIYPAVNIWDREGARRFVSDLRSVDPAVTGHAIITYEAIRIMERSYKQGTLLALLLVSTLTWLMLRRLLDTVLALLPLGLGLVWTVGLMYVFGLPFNLGNIFGLPLIIGSAAEYGLNVVVRYAEGRAHGGPLIARSTMMAVLVNGLTTVVGFGSLMMADHRGIFGLGLLLTLGTGAALLAALVVLPVLLQLMGPHPTVARTPAPAALESVAGG